MMIVIIVMHKSIQQKFGSFLKSQIRGKIVEVSGNRSEGLLKDIIKNFGENALFINTLSGGIEGYLKNSLNGDCVLYTLSENYFNLRLNIKDAKGVQRLVKQFVNEIIKEIKFKNFELVIIYRANDLPPYIFGMDQNIIEEEFWRLLIMDLRSVDAISFLIYEKIEYRPDILSQFADNIIKISESHSPQLWSVF